MYYNQETIRQIKEKVNIVELVSKSVALEKKSSCYIGTCPFCKDTIPTLSVSEELQSFQCFSCGAGGDCFTFVEKQQGCSFPDAVKYLTDDTGIRLPERVNRSEEKLLKVNEEAARFYHEFLYTDEGKAGLSYLKERGLTDETIEKFQLGFAPETADKLTRHLIKKGFSRETIKEACLLRVTDKGTCDYFWNRVMFPIFNKDNQIVAFGGRVLGDGVPKYLNTAATPVFEKRQNLYGYSTAQTAGKPILLCEGYMDVIALHQAGFSGAVAALGTAFTPQHAELLGSVTKTLYLTFDSDEAGVKATLRAIEMLRDAGFTLKVIDMKPYKDPDEFIKNLGAAEYEQRILQAQKAEDFERQYRQTDTRQEQSPEEILKEWKELKKALEKKNQSYLRD
jgi:DNA primase